MFIFQALPYEETYDNIQYLDIIPRSSDEDLIVQTFNEEDAGDENNAEEFELQRIDEEITLEKPPTVAPKNKQQVLKTRQLLENQVQSQSNFKKYTKDFTDKVLVLKQEKVNELKKIRRILEDDLKTKKSDGLKKLKIQSEKLELKLKLVDAQLGI